jgi:hypothetical protein
MVKNKKKIYGADATNMLSTAYTATASVGRAMSWFQLAGSIFFGIILIIIGIIILNSDSTSYDISTTAIITNTSCSGSGKSSSCTLTLSYSVNEEKMSTNITANGVYNIGQNINIKYNSKNPHNITLDTISSSFIAWMFIIFGIFVIIGSSIWFYFVQTNETIAAASGVGEIAGIAKSGFNNNDFNTNYSTESNDTVNNIE